MPSAVLCADLEITGDMLMHGPVSISLIIELSLTFIYI